MIVRIGAKYGENMPNPNGYKSRWFYKEVAVEVEIGDPDSEQGRVLHQQWDDWAFRQAYASVQRDIQTWMGWSGENK